MRLLTWLLAENPPCFFADCAEKAILTYEKIDSRSIDFQHTVVPEAFRGQGIGKLLAKVWIVFVYICCQICLTPLLPIFFVWKHLQCELVSFSSPNKSNSNLNKQIAEIIVTKHTISQHVWCQTICYMPQLNKLKYNLNKQILSGSSNFWKTNVTKKQFKYVCRRSKTSYVIYVATKRIYWHQTVRFSVNDVHSSSLVHCTKK